MLRRLIRDESGVALGLAVVMIVLIGVMGAGLLVFVRTGLNSTVQVNQGQKAIDMADAGVQAAKRQLVLNAAPNNYDNTTNLSANPPNPADSEWSYAGAGKTLSLGGCNNCINVKIRYLLPARDETQRANPDYAPELTPNNGVDANYAPGVDYFRITSEGTVGGTRRVVDAIYVTQTSGVPQGWYTLGNMQIGGSITIEGLSLFARGSINVSGNPTTQGTDIAYGNWNRPPWNTKARATDLPGLGAVGTVTGSNALSTRDFGSNSSPQFVLENPSSNQMTFPFDYRQQPILEDLRNAASSQNTAVRPQGNYYEVACGTTQALKEASATEAGPKWPANSTTETVVYVRFTCTTFSDNSILNWDVSQSAGDRRGTLVIENGRMELGQNKACLNGIAVIRGVPTDKRAYNSTGGSCLKGYVNASGEVRIQGNISPFTLERGNRPGFYGVQLWSWRECYSYDGTTCT